MKSTAKRRRSKAQIKQERKDEEKRKEEIQAKLLAWDDLEAELEKKIQENKELAEVNQHVGQMFDNGVLK
jgi:hypothetical protein